MNSIKFFITLSALLLLLSCSDNKTSLDRNNTFEEFDSANHFLPVIDRNMVDTLHGWEYCWKFVSPIEVMIEDVEHENERVKRLSPGQKTLHFIRYLNDEVTNGGFVQYYWNGYEKYIPPTMEGLRHIGDTAMVDLIQHVEESYTLNKAIFETNKKKNEFSEIYESLEWYNTYDKRFFEIQNQTFSKMEDYIRANPGQFARFKEEK